METVARLAIFLIKFNSVAMNVPRPSGCNVWDTEDHLQSQFHEIITTNVCKLPWNPVIKVCEKKK